jgi:hypothetical protein
MSEKVEAAKKEFRPMTDDSADAVVPYIDDGTGIEQEEIESEGQITQPFDPTLMRVETKQMSLDALITRIREGELDLEPGFQRKAGIWKDEAQSRLIESILIRVPLPAFYMDATDEDKWLVVDGLQRLTTLRRFVIDQELKLKGLEFLKLHGKTFNDLPRNFQRRINETQITVYLIEKGTPPEVKFNIFKRINTGGAPLSAQEIRHALNQGKATKLLERLANSKEFKRATNNGIRDDRMADRECVLRFLAFTIVSYTAYRAQDFDSFLSTSMAEMNKFSDQEIDDLAERFLRAMRAAFGIFGPDAFRKRYIRRAPRYPINKALFEAWSVNLNMLDDYQLQVLQDYKDTVQKCFINLMNNDRDFENSISLSTGSIRRIKYRFEVIGKLISEVLHDPSITSPQF